MVLKSSNKEKIGIPQLCFLIVAALLIFSGILYVAYFLFYHLLAFVVVVFIAGLASLALYALYRQIKCHFDKQDPSKQPPVTHYHDKRCIQLPNGMRLDRDEWNQTNMLSLGGPRTRRPVPANRNEECTIL